MEDECEMMKVYETEVYQQELNDLKGQSLERKQSLSSALNDMDITSGHHFIYVFTFNKEHKSIILYCPFSLYK